MGMSWGRLRGPDAFEILNFESYDDVHSTRFSKVWVPTFCPMAPGLFIELYKYHTHTHTYIYIYKKCRLSGGVPKSGPVDFTIISYYMIIIYEMYVTKQDWFII